VWVYGVLQLGLHRLGRERLLPDAARVDPTLGMRPFGALAGWRSGCSSREGSPSYRFDSWHGHKPANR
jgi:hypothetical protein